MKSFTKFALIILLLGIMLITITACDSGINKTTKATTVGTVTTAATGNPLAGLVAGGAVFIIEYVDEVMTPTGKQFQVIERTAVKLKSIGWIFTIFGILMIAIIVYNLNRKYHYKKQFEHYKQRKEFYKEKATANAS